MTLVINMLIMNHVLHLSTEMEGENYILSLNTQLEIQTQFPLQYYGKIIIRWQ